jgi:hypothetical protein
MKADLFNWWASEKQKGKRRAQQALMHANAVRVVNALTYILVLMFLGIWIASFILITNDVFSHVLSGNILTNLSCLIFFGGLILSISFGAVAGKFLTRFYWKLRTKRFT